MLYPDFNELIQLGQKASRLRIVSGRQSMAAGSGDYASPFRGQGLAFHEVREYRFGDDIRSIDWRVTARTDKPYVKVFTEERERTVILCVDANAAMRFGTRGTFKSVQAARAAALLGSQSIGNNDRVGCLLFGDVAEGIQFFTPVRSRRALWQALKLLSAETSGAHDAPVTPETALKYLERVTPTGALLLVIGDFQQPTDLLEKQIGNLRRTCDVVLIPVNDPADRELPAMETIIFADDAGRKVTMDTDSRDGREAYALQWRESRMRLEDIAARRGIGLVDLHTDHDVYADLLLGLRRLNIGEDQAMTPDQLLSQLYDIRGLDTIDWWPLAPGWWAVLALAAIVAGTFYWRRWAYYRSWKGEAWRAFVALEARLAADNAARDAQEIVGALSILLRRVAMQGFSRAECAGLEGQNWLLWLAAKDPGGFNWAERGTALIDAPYAPPERGVSPQSLKPMIAAAKRWVK